jgi:phosphomethylpyrimidine synthase
MQHWGKAGFMVLDSDVALFPEDAMRIRNERSPSCDEKVCTMCGEFCANRASSAIFQETLSVSHKA